MILFSTGLVVLVCAIVIMLALEPSAPASRDPFEGEPAPPMPNANNNCKCCSGRGGWPDPNEGWDHCPQCDGDPTYGKGSQ